MIITKEFLNEHDACSPGRAWFFNQTETDLVKVIEKLMTENHFDWANWLITRVLNDTQKIQYAIFAAETVIDIYKKQYPNDDRPRKAIEATKNYLENQNKESARAAAYAAAYAAYAAAYAAADAAYAAADAAYAAVKEKIINYGLSLILNNEGVL